MRASVEVSLWSVFTLLVRVFVACAVVYFGVVLLAAVLVAVFA